MKWKQSKTFLWKTLLSVFSLSLLSLTGCGKMKTDVPLNAEKVDYASYDGYGYYLEDGQPKYLLDTKADFLLHCFFQSDSEDYYEKIYTLDLSSAAQSDGILSISHITDEQNTDLSSSFEHLTFSFYQDYVVMDVKRIETQLAGGASDNILSGKYTLSKEPKASSFSPASETGTPSASDATAAPTGGDSSSHSSRDEPCYQSGELIAMAKAYYEKNSGFLPPEATCTANDDNTYTIQLYEIVDDGDGAYHTATSAWYTVDKGGSGTDDILGTSIALEALSIPDVLTYMGTPTMLLYAQRSEASAEWEIEDTQVIASCIESLKSMTTGKENEMRCTDSGSLLTFLLKDGSQYALTFEESDLVIDDIRYETEGGFAALKPLQDYVQELNQ